MFRIEKFKGRGTKPWRWRVVSTRNGQTILTSQGYYSKYNLERAVRRLAAANGFEQRWV